MVKYLVEADREYTIQRDRIGFDVKNRASEKLIKVCVGKIELNNVLKDWKNYSNVNVYKLEEIK